MGGSYRCQVKANPVASFSGEDELFVISELKEYVCLVPSTDTNNNNDIHIVSKFLKFKGEDLNLLSRKELTLDNGDSTSASWARISDIVSNMPFESEKMYWLHHQDDGEIAVPLKNRNQLVAHILQEARTVAAMQTEQVIDGSSSNVNYDLQLSITYDVLLDDYHAFRAQELEQQATIRQIFNEAASMFVLPNEEDRARLMIRVRLSDNNLLDSALDDLIDNVFQEYRRLNEALAQSDAT